jgi:hypothetical protein
MNLAEVHRPLYRTTMTENAYRLKDSLSAIQDGEISDDPVRVQLTTGTIVSITRRVPGSDLVNIEADGKVLIVFLSDLEQCSEPLQASR